MQLQWCAMKYTLMSTGEFFYFIYPLTKLNKRVTRGVGAVPITHHRDINHDSRETMDANTYLDTV